MTRSVPWWATALPAAAVVVVLLWLGLQRGPNLDAAVFLTIAEQMRDGAMPYRDLFDHKPPGIYLTEYAVGVLLPFVDPWTRAWGITLVAAVGTLLLLAHRLGPISRIGTTLALLAASPLLGAFAFAQSGGYTESLAVLPATAGVMVATRSIVGPRAGLVAGLLLGLSLAVSFQLAPAVVGVLVSLLVGSAGRLTVAAFAAGGALVGTILLAWLAAVGALPAALDQLIAYNRAYGEGQSLFDVITLATIAALLVMIAPPIAAAALRGVEVVRSRMATPLELAGVVWVVGSIAFIVYQGRFFGHYLTPWITPLVLLAVPVVARIRPEWQAQRRAAVIAVAALAIGFPLYFVVRFEPGTQHREPTWTASQELAAVTEPDERVFVWGNDAAVYLYARRQPAGPYVFLWPLTQAAYPSDGMVAALLASWETAAPAAIVDASDHPTGPSSAPLLASTAGGGPVSARLDPLRAFVAQHYVRTVDVGAWSIYVRN